MPGQVRDTAAVEEPRLAALLKSIDDLYSIPETLLEILRILDDQRSSVEDLAVVIRRDAPLMAKILRLANSPYYSGTRHLADLQGCIAVLGFRLVRQVALCVSIAGNLVAKCNQAKCRIDYRELWRHSVVVGVIAKQLGIIGGDSDPEELFTAGLLHDVGKFVILLKAPLQYEQVFVRRREERRPLVEVEVEMLGFDHASAGAAFGDAWSFPEILIQCARRHHQHPAQAPGLHRGDRASALIALADGLAHQWEPGSSDLGYDPIFLSMSRLHEAADLDPVAVEAHKGTVRTEIRSAGAFLELA